MINGKMFYDPTGDSSNASGPSSTVKLNFHLFEILPPGGNIYHKKFIVQN
jgi:hypothetical protein